VFFFFFFRRMNILYCTHRRKNSDITKLVHVKSETTWNAEYQYQLRVRAEDDLVPINYIWMEEIGEVLHIPQIQLKSYMNKLGNT